MHTAILNTFQHFQDGATKTDIRGRVGQGKAFDAAWLAACNSGDLVECEVIRGNRQTYPGFKRVYPAGKNETPDESQTQQEIPFK